MNYLKIKEIFNFQNKSKFKAGEGLEEGEYPFYTSSSEISKYSNRYNFEGESLVFGTGGKPSIHYATSRFSTSTDCYVLQPKNKNVWTKYCYYYLYSNISILERGFKGAGLKHTSKKYLENIRIPLPSIEDQIRIAKILTIADELGLKRKECINLLDKVIKNTFLVMFGDPKTIQLKEKEKLNNHINFLTSGSRGWAKYYSETGDKFLRIQNVGKGHLKLDEMFYVMPPSSAESKRTKVESGDLLISITADLGRTAVIPPNFGNAYINQHLALLRLKKSLNPIYAAYFYSMPFGYNAIQKKNRVGVKSGLNFDDLRKLPIYVPAKDLQEKFSIVVKKIESLKSKYMNSLTELGNLFGSLNQEAFKGGLDLSKIKVVSKDYELLDTINVSGDNNKIEKTLVDEKRYRNFYP